MPERGVTMVILTAPVLPEAYDILRQCEDLQVIVVHSVGFYSSLDIQFPKLYPISDTHPDPATISDLRLLKPWKELSEYAAKKTSGLDEMDDHDHGHVPWLLLILHYLEIWKQEHNNELPSTFKDKVAFRKFMAKGMRMSSSAGLEENYQQAFAAVIKNTNPPIPSSDVQRIWAEPITSNITSTVCNTFIDLLIDRH
jgi:amyloid beta precursor protein binding protein 1